VNQGSIRLDGEQELGGTRLLETPRQVREKTSGIDVGAVGCGQTRKGYKYFIYK
jgi:hypothetical protein